MDATISHYEKVVAENWYALSEYMLFISTIIQNFFSTYFGWTVIQIPGTESFAENYVNKPLQLNDLQTSKFLATYLVAYACGAILNFIPTDPTSKNPGKYRHIFNIIIGILMVQYAFQVNYMHAVLNTMFCYVILYLGQFIRPIRKWVHWIAAVVVFSYLCLRQIARTTVNASNVDDAVLQMTLTVKLYSFVYNVYDGTAGADDLQKMENSAKSKIEESKNNKELSEDKRKAIEARAQSTLRTVKDRRERSVTSLPPLINVLGYAFNPTSVMSGPGFEYSMYEGAMSRDKNPENAPSRIVPVIIKVTYAVTCLLNCAIYKNIYSLDNFYKGVELRVNNDPNAPSFLSHVMAYYIVFFVIRLQYYGVWKLSEGAAVLGGFGYQNNAKGNLLFGDIEWVIGEENFASLWKTILGTTHYEKILAAFGLRLKTSKGQIPDWEGATNVAPLSEESRRLPGELIRVWNIHTQSWLERYIMKRAPRGINKWLTYFVSAFWHGFAPGYYLALISAPFVLESARVVYESCGPFLDFLGIRWFFQPERNSLRYLIIVIAHWMFLQACWMYTFGPFMLYEYRKGLNFWKSYNYSGHLIALSFYIFTLFLKIAFPKKRRDRETNGNGKEKEKEKEKEN